MKKSKKLITGLLTGCLTISLAAMALADQEKEQVDVYADQQLTKSVVFKVGSDQYFVNGQVPGVKMDAAPYINQNRTFVPVRYLANALGVPNEKISYDKNTVALNAEKVVAQMTVGQKKIITNDVSKNIDVAPELKTGRTYLPARFVAEGLGYEVDFIDGVVVCWPAGTDKPVDDVQAVNQYLNPQQVATQPAGTYNLNGYAVPTKPETEILIDKGGDVDIVIEIVVPNSDVSKQCDEAEKILASKFDKGFANKVVNVARQKTDYFNHEVNKEFTGPNGETVEVLSYRGDVWTSIRVWSAKGGSN